MGNITSIASDADARAYQYDALSRLAQVEDGKGSVLESFTYDATGNRLSKLEPDAGTVQYSYEAGTHRLSAVGGAARTYDDAGALTSRADGWTYRYDARQRLSSISYAGILRQTNQYNAKGERVLRTSGSGMSSTTHYFVHDEEGHLIAEYQKIGLALPALQKQYLWLDGRPVAIKVNSGAYSGELPHVHSDHLGSPRAVTRPAEQDAVVWRWDVQESAFGENDPNEDPDGNGPPLTLNLRFPGQYADSVTRTHYNYFRDYEPGTGRYLESDPIGLLAGINTYAYVRSTPLSFLDPLGLAEIPAAPPEFLPGGPWTPQPGQQPGTFQGPPQPSGPRAMCRYVPEDFAGPGSNPPYWKLRKV